MKSVKEIQEELTAAETEAKVLHGERSEIDKKYREAKKKADNLRIELVKAYAATPPKTK